MEREEEYMSEINQTWRKVAEVSKKVGLREGIMNGRESQFQEYFDIGYIEGFKNGHALGKYKGTLTAHCKQVSSGVQNHQLLHNVRYARCVLCKDERLLDENVPEVIRKQTEAFEHDLQDLCSIVNITDNNDFH